MVAPPSVRALILLLAACHLFANPRVECAAGEACLDDSGPDDSAPVLGPPSVGLVVSAVQDDRGRVRRFNAKGQQVKEWAGFSGAGPVAFDPVTGGAVVVQGGTLVHLPAEGAAEAFALATEAAQDLVFRDGVAWIAATDRVLGFGPASGFERVVADGLGDATAVEIAETLVWFTDTGDGRPDLYAADLTTYAVDHLATDFDGVTSRGRNLFLGPGEEPWACSRVGAMYRIADLAEGRTVPGAWLDLGADDVTDCAYDPSDESWLAFSPSLGAWSLEADGTLEELVAPPSDGTAFVRAGFHR